MILDLTTAVPAGTPEHPISVERLKLILDRAHIDYKRWVPGRRIKSLNHLRGYLASGKALLVPSGASCTLVEPILVLDIRRVLSETLTLHLYEKDRRPWRAKKHHPPDHTQPSYHNIGLRMQVGETARAAAERCLEEKLGFVSNIHVLFDETPPQILDQITRPSSRYPGLSVIQHRVRVACTLFDEKYKPQYRIHRRGRTITSVYEWQPKATGAAR